MPKTEYALERWQRPGSVAVDWRGFWKGVGIEIKWLCVKGVVQNLGYVYILCLDTVVVVILRKIPDMNTDRQAVILLLAL
jgi:hypothetical protein